jgi:hypothetical protein
MGFIALCTINQGILSGDRAFLTKEHPAFTAIPHSVLIGVNFAPESCAFHGILPALPFGEFSLVPFLVRSAIAVKGKSKLIGRMGLGEGGAVGR